MWLFTTWFGLHASCAVCVTCPARTVKNWIALQIFYFIFFLILVRNKVRDKGRVLGCSWQRAREHTSSPHSVTFVLLHCWGVCMFISLYITQIFLWTVWCSRNSSTWFLHTLAYLHDILCVRLIFFIPPFVSILLFHILWKGFIISSLNLTWYFLTVLQCPGWCHSYHLENSVRRRVVTRLPYTVCFGHIEVFNTQCVVKANTIVCSPHYFYKLGSIYLNW